MRFFGGVVEKIVEENTQATQKGFQLPGHSCNRILWKQRNACVFDVATPNIQRALEARQDELELWESAGAKGLAALGLQ